MCDNFVDINSKRVWIVFKIMNNTGISKYGQLFYNFFVSQDLVFGVKWTKLSRQNI